MPSFHLRKSASALYFPANYRYLCILILGRECPFRSVGQRNPAYEAAQPGFLRDHMYKEYKQLDLPQTGKEILARWQDKGIFEKSISLRPANKPYTFYEGPPSANGMPGIHHVMARAIKDIFCRYKTLKGYQVKRKGGWDTHGLPIELAVEKTLGITKDDIGKKISVADYNAACRKEVMKYTDV